MPSDQTTRERAFMRGVPFLFARNHSNIGIEKQNEAPMNLEKNYELMDAVRDDGIRTMKAREIASGRALEVHLFMKKEDHALFGRLQGLPLSARRQLLEL